MLQVLWCVTFARRILFSNPDLAIRIEELTSTGSTNKNPGFGDYDEATKSINDFSVANNEDSLRVLATVSSMVNAFTEKYPTAWILATGSHL